MLGIKSIFINLDKMSGYYHIYFSFFQRDFFTNIIILNCKTTIMQKSIDDIDFEKSGGLVPIIVQDANTKEVLTLAYSNKESLELTKKTGNSWFWSRSRNKLWMKGEESGNTQKVKEILVDCDSDAIIYLVDPSGPACHTGERVCFHNNLEK